MGSVVRSYWSGALRRLQAEVDGFASLVQHRGEQGRENELALTRVLSSLIPHRFGTGSGLLVDASDHQSAQVDVVIFEQAMEAALFAQTTQLLYPIETVYAAIEVKTTLTAADVVEFGQKTMKMRALESGRRHHDDSERPTNCLFAYSAWARPNTVLEHLLLLNDDLRPDVACVVDQGFIGGRPDVIGVSEAVDSYTGGVTFLHNDAGDLITVSERGPVYVDGVSYKVMRTASNEGALVDSARALLLFLETLLRALHAKSDGRETVLTLYLDDAMRRISMPPKG